MLAGFSCLAWTSTTLLVTGTIMVLICFIDGSLFWLTNWFLLSLSLAYLEGFVQEFMVVLGLAMGTHSSILCFLKAALSKLTARYLPNVFTFKPSHSMLDFLTILVMVWVAKLIEIYGYNALTSMDMITNSFMFWMGGRLLVLLGLFIMDEALDQVLDHFGMLFLWSFLSPNSGGTVPKLVIRTLLHRLVWPVFLPMLNNLTIVLAWL